MDKAPLSLISALNIKPGLTAVVGAGGKTALIRALCGELSGRARVIVATTTRIWPPDMPVLKQADEAELSRALELYHTVCAAEDAQGGKLGPPLLPMETLIMLADYVFVEADGAKRLPLKAHAPHEPVLPECAASVLQVIGADGLYQTIAEAAHRPELYAEALGVTPEHTVTPADAARLLLPYYPVIINKSKGNPEAAQALARLMHHAVLTELASSDRQVLAVWRDGICSYS